jgi:hypothetical protein
VFFLFYGCFKGFLIELKGFLALLMMIAAQSLKI